MTFEEFLERADHHYESVIRDMMKQHPLSVSKIEEACTSNKKLYDAVYLQDYLRYRTLTTLSVYHDYLRERLIQTAGIDIGDFLGLDESPIHSHDM